LQEKKNLNLDFLQKLFHLNTKGLKLLDFSNCILQRKGEKIRVLIQLLSIGSNRLVSGQKIVVGTWGEEYSLLFVVSS
jgi:hypothetical protein